MTEDELQQNLADFEMVREIQVILIEEEFKANLSPFLISEETERTILMQLQIIMQITTEAEAIEFRELQSRFEEVSIVIEPDSKILDSLREAFFESLEQNRFEAMQDFKHRANNLINQLILDEDNSGYLMSEEELAINLQHLQEKQQEETQNLIDDAATYAYTSAERILNRVSDINSSQEEELNHLRFIYFARQEQNQETSEVSEIREVELGYLRHQYLEHVNEIYNQAHNARADLLHFIHHSSSSSNSTSAANEINFDGITASIISANFDSPI